MAKAPPVVSARASFTACRALRPISVDSGSCARAASTAASVSAAVQVPAEARAVAMAAAMARAPWTPSPSWV